MDEDYPILRHTDPEARLQAGVGIDQDPCKQPLRVLSSRIEPFDPDQADDFTSTAGTENF